MSFRKSIAALVGAGALLTGAAFASPASAAPAYPPGACGATGAGTLSSTRIVVGTTVTFGGADFAAGSTITISVDSVVAGTVTAGADGTFSTPVRFTSVGVHTLAGVGAIGTGCAANGAATSRGSVSSSLANGATVQKAALLAATRTVTATVTVVSVNGAGAGPITTGGGGSGGLPFTGLETGLLVTVALVLMGGGLALRIGSRRRRTAS